MSKYNFKAPLRISVLQLIDSDPLNTFSFIIDSEGCIYHHLDKTWRKKPLKNHRTYTYKYSIEANKEIKRLNAQQSTHSLFEALDPICKDAYMSDIFEALELVETAGTIKTEAKEYLKNAGYTVIPNMSIIDKMKLDEFLSTLTFINDINF